MKIKNVLRWGLGQIARFAFLEDFVLTFASAIGKTRRNKSIAPLGTSLATFLRDQVIKSTIFEVPNYERAPRFGIPENKVTAFCEALEPNFKVTQGKQFLKIEDKSSGTAVSVEVWNLVGSNLVSPTWNPRATIIGAAFNANKTTTLDGFTFLTHPDLAEVEFDNVEFDIDAVYLWVDGEDPDWLARRAEYIESSADQPDLRHSAHKSRFRQADELKYSLRSLANIPWIRNIYVVTASQKPDWLDESNPRIKIVDHSVILPKSALPTFNSHAISANVHRIPGLSENFLYFNDDLFISSRLRKTSWFSGSGVAKVRLTTTLQPGSSAQLHYAASSARRTTIEAAKSLGLPITFGYLQHAPHPMKISLMNDAWKMLAKELSATTRSRFRRDSDVVPEWINNFIGYKKREVQVGEDRPYQYISVNDRTALLGIVDLLLGFTPNAVFCLNDSSEVPAGQALSSERTARRLNKVLTAYFPSKSEFEK